MNIYVGDSISETIRLIKSGVKQFNATIDDILSGYLYILRNEIPYSVIFDIDPYDDEEISKKEDIYNIISMCGYVLGNHLLDNYSEDEDDIDFAILNLNKLIKVSLEAIEKGKKLISIGD